ncbi:hypothetical protein WMY93_004737 [Mugilogobius chulae]|uniref:Uncharacterized protein n=1 Tax=Mugilogobius chulae TaxID=88201 RepID=A0AAW0PSZ7_9GOBI
MYSVTVGGKMTVCRKLCDINMLVMFWIYCQNDVSTEENSAHLYRLILILVEIQVTPVFSAPSSHRPQTRQMDLTLSTLRLLKQQVVDLFEAYNTRHGPRNPSVPTEVPDANVSGATVEERLQNIYSKAMLFRLHVHQSILETRVVAVPSAPPPLDVEGRHDSSHSAKKILNTGLSCKPKHLASLTKRQVEISLAQFDEANGKHLGTWLPGFPDLTVKQNAPVVGAKVQCSLLFLTQGLERILEDQNNLNPEDVSLRRALKESFSRVGMLAVCLQGVLGGKCSAPPAPLTCHLPLLRGNSGATLS